MKKILLAGLIMVVAAITANAQKGSILLYGNLDINTAKDAGVNFGLNPGIGYEFKDNWTLGLNLGFNSVDDKSAVNGEGGTAFNVGPFIRHAMAISNVFAVYGQFEAGYQSNMVAFPNFNFNSVQEGAYLKGSGFNAHLFPALFVNIKNGFGLNFNFGGIDYISFKPDGGTSGSSFAFNFGRSANIGISKTFSRKK